MVHQGEEEENKENFESGEEDEQSRRGAKEQAGRTKSLDIDKDGVDGGVRGLNQPQLLQQGSLRTSQSDNALPSRAIYSVGALGTGRALSGWGRGFMSVCLEHVDDPVTGRPRLMTVVAMDALIQEEPFKVTHLNTGMECKYARVLRLTFTLAFPLNSKLESNFFYSGNTLFVYLSLVTDYFSIRTNTFYLKSKRKNT